MKSVWPLLLLIALSLPVTAQLRQSVYLEGFGRNIVGPALMYERTRSSERLLNLEWGAGIGYVYRSWLDEPQNIVASLPLQLGANLGRRHHKFEMGLAGFIPLGPYREYEDGADLDDDPSGHVYPITLYLGYKRYPKEGNGLYLHFNLQPLVNNSWIPVFPWLGAGIGYSFQKK
ncbi:hypothetical protein [Cesiribacter andamanensis]|uniref:Uncharacterized protein n=1 Tax=Cesiribacter andamanensis AMV16 TaxID=1279009 RepID=M7NI09_9BACT|nr:hypothetical protein [Cesiribacter andamanensis]EMR01450.1 hypothetical protein ADICEAN_03436 [Cesiribacter andamanensis AMV16]